MLDVSDTMGRGAGGDGGVIAAKRKFMRGLQTKEVEKKSESELRDIKVSTCALSGEQLTEPIVACRLGNLYNKDALLRELLARQEGKPPEFKHVQRLKDVVVCRFMTADADADADTAAGAITSSSARAALASLAPMSGAGTGAGAISRSRFICPITRDEFNGHIPFCVIWTSGCVISHKALTQVPSSTCLVTGTPFTPDDVITLAPNERQLEELQHREQARVAAAKAKKKKRKSSKKAVRQAAATEIDAHTSASASASSSSSTVTVPPASMPSLSVPKSLGVGSLLAERTTEVTSEGMQKLSSKAHLKRKIQHSGREQAPPKRTMAAVAARKAVEEQKSSDVYNSLFSKPTKYQDAKELMMTIATARYTT